ncbi:sigma-54 factor interaction domain-containing protein, partial [Clostridioides difficile]|nr:sigma-54 factor interaction domain-containing protein [Clostridioides difficile]
MPVQTVSEIHPKLTYIGNPENPLRDGDEHLLTLQGQRYLVRYRLITGSSGTTGTLIVTASASKPLQDRRQLRGSLVRQGLTSNYTFDDIIAVSQAMQGKIQIAKKFCTANSSVLITGETGTGKELFAHSIHAASRRAGQPFVAVNCAALPESILEGLLFGSRKGAFTGAENRKGLFQEADGGTLYLDEINSMPLNLQAKLLRVLQEKQVMPLGSTQPIAVD